MGGGEEFVELERELAALMETPLATEEAPTPPTDVTPTGS